MENKYIKKPVYISGKKGEGEMNAMFLVTKSDNGLYHQIPLSVSVHTRLPPNIYKKKRVFLKAFKNILSKWQLTGITLEVFQEFLTAQCPKPQSCFVCSSPALLTQRGQLQGAVLQSVTGLVDHKHVQHNVVLIDVDIGFCIHRV